jgi:hypothetical protein
MANENTVTVIGLPVAADYSTTGQYLFVDIAATTGRAVLVAGQGLNAYGVLQDNPSAAGRVGRVAIGGVMKVMSGDTITVGAQLCAGADGRAEIALVGDVVLGKAITGGVDGVIITMLWQPQLNLAS